MRCLCGEPDQVGQIEQGLTGRRSMETALVDLRATHQRRPSSELQRMIQQLEAEVAIRERARTYATADGAQFRYV